MIHTNLIPVLYQYIVSIIKVDVQNCDIKLESWGYLDTKLIFQWDMDGNQIAEGLNKTLNQHYFTEEYRTNENGTGYAGIATGRINNIYINKRYIFYEKFFSG